MDTIFLHYNGHTPSVDETGIPGETGKSVIQVDFNTVWTSYTTRKIVFVSSFGVFVETLDENNRIIVPAEVVSTGEEDIRVSVFGTAQTSGGRVVRYNGESIRIRFYAGEQPEMTKYDKLIKRLSYVEANLDEIKNQVDSATTAATYATRTANTVKSNADTKAASANTAAENANTAATSAINLFTPKSDKVTNATNGNLAGLNASGDLTDSSVSEDTWSVTLYNGTVVTKKVLCATTTASADTDVVVNAVDDYGSEYDDRGENESGLISEE